MKLKRVIFSHFFKSIFRNRCESRNWETYPFLANGGTGKYNVKKKKKPMLTMIALRSKMDNCLLFHSLQSTTTDIPVLFVCFSCSEPRPTERNWPVVFENGFLDYYNYWAVTVLRAELFIL